MRRFLHIGLNKLLIHPNYAVDSTQIVVYIGTKNKLKSFSYEFRGSQRQNIGHAWLLKLKDAVNQKIYISFYKRGFVRKDVKLGHVQLLVDDLDYNSFQSIYFKFVGGCTTENPPEILLDLYLQEGTNTLPCTIHRSSSQEIEMTDEQE